MLLLLLWASTCGANILTGHSEGAVCGYPGLPEGGLLHGVTREQGWPAGHRLELACSEGRVRQGTEARECMPDGTWRGGMPTCRTNLALSQPALQSETLLNYAASMAVDGDLETCSFTPRTLDQRWWQIQIQATLVQSVAVAISPGSFQHFTIFVIDLMEGNKALYKPCATWRGEFEEAVAVFLCNGGEGHRGEYVYIRDDREEQEYFGLCEVQVFPLANGSQCGEPEVPLGGAARVTGTTVEYSCGEGRSLEGELRRRCEGERWRGAVPQCREVECGDPVSPKSGYIEVSNFRGRYQFGAVATYRCNPGHILWGNASRTCRADSSWDGSPPSCSPVSCGNPPAVVNGLVELLNGTTAWQAVAAYTCLPSFSNYGDENTTVVFSTCLEDGAWSGVSLTCMFDPAAVSRNMKRGRSLYWEDSGQMNTSTMVTIGVLSALIVLSLIITIIVISHRKAASAANSRKISRSSTNQLIHDQLGQGGEEEYSQRKCGVIVYDDLNHPHMVEADQEILAAYGTLGPLGSDHWVGSREGSLLGIRSPEAPGIASVRAGDKSPMSERSSGDGGSDRETGHYATVGRLRKRSEDIYSSMRRPDGESDDDPYSSIRVKGDSPPLGRSPGQGSDSSGTASQATVLLAREDVSALYARVDVAKKRNRNSDPSLSPSSPAPAPFPCSPDQGAGGQEQEEEGVYEEVTPRRPPVPLPRSGRGAVSQSEEGAGGERVRGVGGVAGAGGTGAEGATSPDM